MSTQKEVRDVKNLYVSSMAYNIITLTDGALRSIVLLFLVQLKFSAITLAIMFSLYELMGVVMNFVGGILGAKYGMRALLLGSVFGQLLAIILLAPIEVVFPNLQDPVTRNVTAITAYIAIAQLLSGVSKDLMKIQGKSVPKLVTKPGDEDGLFKIISILTGMKNSIKGFGYLFGSLLLYGAGWVGALCVQAGLLFIILPPTYLWMENDLGISKQALEKAKINKKAFQKGWNVNILSLARFFLFGSRDVWFEIATPYFFRSVLLWAPFAVGGFMAGYTIIYGQLQALTSQMYVPKKGFKRLPNRKDVSLWAGLNGLEILILGIGSFFAYQNFLYTMDSTAITVTLIVGIVIFAVIFAISSAVHSYLIVKYSNRDTVSMDVGFYYMSNAGGRLIGTLISGFIYEYTVANFGLSVCLWVSAAFLVISTLISVVLRDERKTDDEQKETALLEAQKQTVPVSTNDEQQLDEEKQDDNEPKKEKRVL